MKYAKTIAIVIALAVMSSAIGVSWAMAYYAPAKTPTDESMPQTMPRFEIEERIRTDAMAYIATLHPETANFMTNLTWTGGVVQTFAPPQTYVFQAQGWSVMIEFPVEGSSTYKVTVGYASQGIGIPYSVSWTGTLHDGNITETQYSFAQ
jgi:hypothetical protein